MASLAWLLRFLTRRQKKTMHACIRKLMMMMMQTENVCGVVSLSHGISSYRTSSSSCMRIQQKINDEKGRGVDATTTTTTTTAADYNNYFRRSSKETMYSLGP